MKNKKGKYFSGNTAILLNCLGIAVLFFIMTKLSKTYTYKLPFQLSYISFPDNKIPSQPLVNEAEITVKATGFNLLKSIISGKSELEIPLDEFQTDQFIICNENIDLFNRLLPKDYKAVLISPDTLPLYLSKKISKTIPVKLCSKITFEQQYDAIEEILIEPDSVKISGTKQSLKNIKFWPTDTLNLSSLKETKEGYISLQKPDQLNINLKPGQVKYLQTVEEFTEAVVNVKVKIINQPDSIEIIIFPKNVSISYQVGLSNYEKSKDDIFEVVADFKGVDLSEKKSLKLKLETTPHYTKKHRISPTNVDFILYKD